MTRSTRRNPDGPRGVAGTSGDDDIAVSVSENVSEPASAASTAKVHFDGNKKVESEQGIEMSHPDSG